MALIRFPQETGNNELTNGPSTRIPVLSDNKALECNKLVITTSSGTFPKSHTGSNRPSRLTQDRHFLSIREHTSWDTRHDAYFCICRREMVRLSSGSRNLSKMSTRSSWKMQEPNLSACLMRKKRRKMSFWWIAGEIQIHFTTKCLERIYRYDSEHVHNKALNIVYLYVFIQLATISTFLFLK